MKHIKFSKTIILFILFIFFVLTLAKSYSDYIFSDISNSFLRLHIVANSDSTKDQVVKYQIRDSILHYISPYLKNAKTKQDAINILENNIDEFYNISDKILKENNINYPVNISIGNFKFPTKDYSSFILPEGKYDALKIELGNSSGQNWWCVMFPSLCLIDSNDLFVTNSTFDVLNNNLNSEELSIVTKNESSPDIKIKFKLIELFENL